MNFFELFVRSPINRQTMRVTSQKNTVEIEKSLSRAELVEINSMLIKKQSRLKSILQIESKAQHKSMMYKIDRGFVSFRFEKNPRIALEYKRLGVEINRLNSEISAIKKHAKMVREIAA